VDIFGVRGGKEQQLLLLMLLLLVLLDAGVVKRGAKCV
jgi:hypothetical protein